MVAEPTVRRRPHALPPAGTETRSGQLHRVWVILLIPSGHPHELRARMGRTCRRANESDLTATHTLLNGSTQASAFDSPPYLQLSHSLELGRSLELPGSGTSAASKGASNGGDSHSK